MNQFVRFFEGHHVESMVFVCLGNPAQWEGGNNYRFDTIKVGIEFSFGLRCVRVGDEF